MAHRRSAGNPLSLPRIVQLVASVDERPHATAGADCGPAIGAEPPSQRRKAGDPPNAAPADSASQPVVRSFNLFVATTSLHSKSLARSPP